MTMTPLASCGKGTGTSSFMTTAWASSSTGLVARAELPLNHQSLASSGLIGGTVKSLQCKIKPQSCKTKFLKVSCSYKSEVPVLEASCMDEVYDSLAARLLLSSAASTKQNFKYIIGLAGPPGAGKSTLASEVVHRLNKVWPQKASGFDVLIEGPDVATVLPMDGFHLYRHQLDAMEDPKEAHARRGAPWTFDPTRLLKCLQTLRSEGSVYVPSFDHGVGDPVEDDIFVSPQHKIVIVEGNYLLLEEGIWSEVSTMFDEKWFIEIDIDTSMERVVKRHIQTGKPPDVAKWRIDYNDRPNAELILKSKKNADLVIRSIDFSK